MLTSSPAPISADEMVSACAYAAEAMRRWRLEPEWLETDQPVITPGLTVEQTIRRERQLGALRILWCELNGAHDVEQTGRALSALAARCIERALNEAERITAEKFGQFSDRHGQPVRLCVLALGKLGGNELNFNSDLDLVFVHDAQGQSAGRRALGPEEYFKRVVIEMTRLLETATTHGRGWVIDTRLRPFGQSGALVWSLVAMERYFVDEGRVWERYAWLKARPVAGDLAIGQRVVQILQPFIFRRYLDYGLFESLRDLHDSIDRKSRREDLVEDIKRGAGGIRELEFLVQSLQLLRGGRLPALRVSGFLPALRALQQQQLVEPDQAVQMADNYAFLRALENRLQAVTGRQTHQLPDDDAACNTLARLMGQAGWSALQPMIDRVRRQVSEQFHASFDEPSSTQTHSHALWPPPEQLERQLADVGFEQAKAAADAMRQLADRLARRAQSAEARRRLDRLMPVLLDEILQHRPPDTGLADMLGLVETIARRSAYLALLYERPETLRRMVRVFRRSSRVAQWVINSPHLLDDLLDPINGFYLPSLPGIAADDFEAGLNTLARFRQAGFVRTALGQLDGSLDRNSARSQLTRLAETVVKAAAELTQAEHEPPPAMIGYGNLGAESLHYSSDLDLVFLHSGSTPPLRSVQKLISAMQLPLAGGHLYQIDTRLRPNGGSGMLVSTMDSFARYQHERAWLWEHQALIRARCITADTELQRQFEHVRRTALCRPRDPDETRKTMLDMRQRQRSSRHEALEKSLLTDIQFIAELGVLLHAAEHPRLIDVRTTDEQLNLLNQIGWIRNETFKALIKIQAEASALRDWYYLERDFAAEPRNESIALCK
ncbi:MAG: bifunctional [glutamate--ammonia ligase]-adenylyl-L-tyrosine phosphorylase/[glutamate--ammonia-ligase] adenylyltransferase, partial [Pseudomonadota bacterium]